MHTPEGARGWVEWFVDASPSRRQRRGPVTKERNKEDLSARGHRRVGLRCSARLELSMARDASLMRASLLSRGGVGEGGGGGTVSAPTPTLCKRVRSAAAFWTPTGKLEKREKKEWKHGRGVWGRA